MNQKEWKETIEAYLRESDAAGETAEATLTLGQLLDLMDPERLGGVQIRVLGPDEVSDEDGLSGPTSSDLWEPFEGCAVGTLGLEDGPRLVVCLDEMPGEDGDPA